MLLVITKYEPLDKRASATWFAAESTRSTLFSLAAVTFGATRHMHEHNPRHLKGGHGGCQVSGIPRQQSAAWSELVGCLKGVHNHNVEPMPTVCNAFYFSNGRQRLTCGIPTQEHMGKRAARDNLVLLCILVTCNELADLLT